MPKRRFPTPRSYAVFPRQFGSVQKRDQPFTGWLEVATLPDLVGLRAAEVHHAWSKAARLQIQASGALMEDLEERMDLGKRRLGKLLNGHVHLALSDAFRVEAVIGPILVGLRIKWWPVRDDALAASYPNAKALWTWDGYAEHLEALEERRREGR